MTLDNEIILKTLLIMTKHFSHIKYLCRLANAMVGTNIGTFGVLFVRFLTIVKYSIV